MTPTFNAGSRLVDRLCRLVSLRSVSKEETEVADAVEAELRAALERSADGSIQERASASSADGSSRVARIGNNVIAALGTGRPRLLLNSHLDTVPPGQGWTNDPWTPRVDAGRIVGLGANDAKGCAAAMIEATLAIQRGMERGQRFNGTLVMALTAEEEISGAGGLSSVLEALKPIDAAVVGEPTGLVPMIAQRGLLILKGVARGRSGHPANTPPDSADNAILTAAEDLLRLRDFDWGDPHPLLGRCHAHVTMISGGVARNVIPDACEYFLDVRTTPNHTHRELFQRIKAALHSELSIHSERLVPVETPPDAAIVQAVLRALPGATPAGSPTMSDMVFLSGIPCVKIGPGESSRSHTPDEYVTLQELETGAAAYERIIREFFGVMTKSEQLGAKKRGLDNEPGTS